MNGRHISGACLKKQYLFFADEVFFRLECGNAAGSRGNNGLSVVGVFDVSGSKDSFNVGFAAVGLGYDITVLVQFEAVSEEFGVGMMSDGYKHAVDLQQFALVGFNVFDFETGDAQRVFGTDDLFDNTVPLDIDFGVFEQAFL